MYGQAEGERLRRDVEAHTGTRPTDDDQIALSATAPDWSDLADSTDWDALYADVDDA